MEVAVRFAVTDHRLENLPGGNRPQNSPLKGSSADPKSRRLFFCRAMPNRDFWAQCLA
jgi:hypothetical protein